MTDEHKLYLYRQCQRFAATDCPDELQGHVDDVAHQAFVKAMKELPTLQPQPGKTMENCIEGLACLRVIDAYRRFKTDKERYLRSARPVSPTDAVPDDGDRLKLDIALPAAHDAMDQLMEMVDRKFLPDWVRELRRVRDQLYGRDRLLANTLLAESSRTNGLANYRHVRRKLGMSWREFYTRLGRLRRRFRKALDMFQDYCTK